MARLQANESRTRIDVKKPASILDDLTGLHEDISRRAYELFCAPDGLIGGPLNDWFRAERELVWSPAIELRQKDGQFDLTVAVAGVEAKDLDLRVTPEDILITATGEHQGQHQYEAKEGTLHVSEFAAGRLFRSIHLPERIDPDSAKAEYRNGMLRLTAAIAKDASKNVDVQAA
jgi:HSP20 family molecular chaperone IbpA